MKFQEWLWWDDYQGRYFSKEWLSDSDSGMVLSMIRYGLFSQRVRCTIGWNHLLQFYDSYVRPNYPSNDNITTIYDSHTDPRNQVLCCLPGGTRMHHGIWNNLESERLANNSSHNTFDESPCGYRCFVSAKISLWTVIQHNMRYVLVNAIAVHSGVEIGARSPLTPQSSYTRSRTI